MTLGFIFVGAISSFGFIKRLLRSFQKRRASLEVAAGCSNQSPNWHTGNYTLKPVISVLRVEYFTRSLPFDVLTLPAYHSAVTFVLSVTVPPRLCPYMIEPTRLCPHTFVPTHVCAHTRLCPHTFVPTHVCAQTRYNRVVTIMTGHKCVWAQMCLGTNFVLN